ncbi:hypothetical protein FHS15_005308, partial [Paenibacillus castaneae]|uniref:hypothetical protein n=1 Tax=Paenibacillus castaneae TaxID=474957 RepID=UPI001ABBAFBC
TFIAFSLIPKDLRGSLLLVVQFSKSNLLFRLLLVLFVVAVSLSGDLNNISRGPNDCNTYFEKL